MSEQPKSSFQDGLFARKIEELGRFGNRFESHIRREVKLDESLHMLLEEKDIRLDLTRFISSMNGPIAEIAKCLKTNL